MCPSSQGWMGQPPSSPARHCLCPRGNRARITVKCSCAHQNQRTDNQALAAFTYESRDRKTTVLQKGQVVRQSSLQKVCTLSIEKPVQKPALKRDTKRTTESLKPIPKVCFKGKRTLKSENLRIPVRKNKGQAVCPKSLPRSTQAPVLSSLDSLSPKPALFPPNRVVKEKESIPTLLSKAENLKGVRNVCRKFNAQTD